MEVTPEIFAWLTSLNIINPFVPFSEDLLNDFQIPEKTVRLLMGGKYFDKMIQLLQEVYNKYFKINEDYVSNLMKLKQISEGQEYISNSLKYTNWKIIFEVLSHFGLSFSEDDLSHLINNDIDQLKNVITKIYYTYTKYLNGGNENNYNYYNYNFNTINKEVEQKEIKNKNKQNDLININDIDPLKNYEECLSLLEFIILSLCKNMNMKPRQAVTLLSKNRKYLKKICISGYNYNFEAIKNWLTDLYNNKEILLKLIANSEDSLDICYSTIGSALFCKELDISLQAGQLLKFIKYKIGMNYDWFYNEGINTFIFIINKEENKLRKEFLNLLYDFIRDNIPMFFEEIQKKFNDNKRGNNNNDYSIKKSIYDFISNIISLMNNMDKDFIFYFQKLIYDICLTDNLDISYNISILADSFYIFNPIEEDKANEIIAYFKQNIKSNKQNIYSTAISQIFILMEKFGKIKNKYAPYLYKNIAFIFIDEYDNEKKREIFLENFEKFFNNNHDIPIDILLESYLNKINGCQNYGLSDFLFLLKMVEHPRIEAKELFAIIQFLLNVCLNNIPYARCANLILSLIFEKELIDKTFNLNKGQDSLYVIEQIENKFIEFISMALDMYISNISNEEDKFILETPYDIMTQNYENVNMEVKEMIINCVKKYRNIKGCHSSGLLAMMWYYNDNDDIMMQIEELNRPIYEPIKVQLEKKRKEQEEKDKHDYTKKLMINLKHLRDKKMNDLLNKQAANEQQKLKEERLNKIKKQLNEKKRIIRLISGNEARIKPQILEPIPKMSKSNSEFYEQVNKSNNLLHRPNNLETGNLKSNMVFALNKALNNYMNKGVINEKNSLKKNIKLKRSSSERYIYENKNHNEINKKKYLNDEDSEILRSNKMEEMAKFLIQKEGTLINHGIINKKKYLLPKSFALIHSGIPFNLDEEENREIKAIKGYNKSYRKNLKYYFQVYGNTTKQKITKSNFVRLLRDVGLDKEYIEYDEISTLIRLMFKDNFSEFDFNHFINLLVQLSYIIYFKRRPCLTIGETYGNLLKRLSFKNINQERLSALKKKYSKVIDYLLQLKEGKEPFIIPEGFKFVQKTFVKYNYRLAPHMMNYMGESNFICYQVLEEIIFGALKTSIIEPFIEISYGEDVEIEPERVHNWSPGLTMAYIDLNPNLRFYGKFAADAIEEGITKILKKEYGLNAEGKVFKFAKGILNVKWVQQGIEKKKEYHNKQIIELERKKSKKEKDENKYKRTISKVEQLKVEEKFKKIKLKIQKKEEEKEQKKKNKEKIEKEMREKKSQELKPFIKNKRKELKEQFDTMKSKQNEIKKEREEEEKKQAEKLKRRDYIISEEEKNYKEFEKNINNSIKELLDKEEMKACLDKYINHLKIIYDIYSKIGYNKISFNSKEVMRLDEFRQFLMNFAVLGVYINTDQMNWIFRTIAKVSQNERYNEMYFDFNDFQLSLLYLTILSKYENKTFKIMPKDIEELNEINLEKFLQNLGLKLPFDKVELERFINKRRSMPMKNMLSIQHNLKLEEAKNYANNKKNEENSDEENDNENDNEEENSDSKNEDNNSSNNKSNDNINDNEKDGKKKQENNKKENGDNNPINKNNNIQNAIDNTNINSNIKNEKNDKKENEGEEDEEGGEEENE